MAAVARLLLAGNVSTSIPGEVGYHKLAANYIAREIQEADEANLIDEEDMHVYGSRPMRDPLHLVCCNACKKPIKASQFAAHAELCKSLYATEQVQPKLEGGKGKRKPPRREKRKLLSAFPDQPKTVDGQGQLKILDAGENASSRSRSKGQIQTKAEATRNMSADGKLAAENSGLSPQNAGCMEAAKPRPRKRSKKMSADSPPMVNDLGKISLSKNVGKSAPEAITDNMKSRRSTTGSEKTCDHFASRMPGKINEFCVPQKDVPSPLATKVYYSQRNQRLRAAVSHMYYASSQEHCPQAFSPKVMETNALPTQNLSPGGVSHEQFNQQQDKVYGHYAQIPHQILSQGSQSFLGKQWHPPTMNVATPLPKDHVLRPQAPLGMISNNYIFNSYSFTANSGNLLRRVQQPEGRVSVV